MSKKYFLTIFICFLLLGFLATFLVFAFNLNIISKNQMFPNNASIAGVDVSKLTKSQTKEMLSKAFAEYTIDSKITLSSGGEDVTIPLSDYAVFLELDQSIDEAYNSYHEGSYFIRLYNYVKTQIIPLDSPLAITFDDEKLVKTITRFAERVEDDSYLINNNYLTVNLAADIVDIDATFNSVVSAIKLNKLNEAKIFLASSPKEKANSIRKHLPEVPVEPRVENDEGGNTVFIEGKSAIRFDQNELERQIRSGNVNIKLDFTPPNETLEQLRQRVFSDVLGTYTTNFSTSSYGRKTNIRTAAERINGKVLMPGETFSFNNIVGERTFAAGFAMGHVFVAGEVIDGVGGGICQVSTTLYSAALYADLEIKERYNHQFAIGYAPSGQDATVSWGEIDFQFVNSTNSPIKLILSTQNDKLKVDIMGYNENPDKTIQLEHKTMASRAYSTSYKPTAGITKDKVTQNGQIGLTIESYKKIYNKGKLVDTIFLHRSVYNPMPCIILTPIPSGEVPPVEDHPPEGTIYEDAPEGSPVTDESIPPAWLDTLNQ